MDAIKRSDTEADTEEALELRFEVFMDELEAHADPAFGDGAYPEVNRAARALMDALESAFRPEGSTVG
ncbi:MAG: hypothetical protein ACYCZN_04540 [Candidatus Dormibacteria bacterium]